MIFLLMFLLLLLMVFSMFLAILDSQDLELFETDIIW